MSTLLRQVSKVMGSLGLSCTLLLLLGLLTWLGTLEQVHTGLFEVQKKYFESFILVHDAGPISIPLPGANLVLCVLFVNLMWGGVVRLRDRTGAKLGILITHLGILFLLASGFVKLYYSEDGHVTLFERQSSDYFQSYYRWELAIAEDLGNGRVREYLVPQEDFLGATGTQPLALSSAELPFTLELSNFMANCRPLPKGPMFDVDVPVIDGFFLEAEPLDPEAERNTAGVYLTVVDRATGARDGTPQANSQQNMVWGLASAPWTFRAGGKTFAADLRHQRYPMPFTLVLDDFRKEDHPRMGMAKSFESDVTVIEDGSRRPVEISMNEPLREKGLVVYQASWGPSNAGPGDALFSTFSVVRNPADQYPLYACIVIAMGLLLHFLRKLFRYIRVEARTS